MAKFLEILFLITCLIVCSCGAIYLNTKATKYIMKDQVCRCAEKVEKL
jgi:hypothetical protein